MHSKRVFEARLEGQSAYGLGYIRSKHDEARNRIHARNGTSSPLLVYIDLLALLYILQA